MIITYISLISILLIKFMKMFNPVNKKYFNKCCVNTTMAINGFNVKEWLYI